MNSNQNTKKIGVQNTYMSNGSRLSQTQGQIARNNHRDGYNQMQSLGDALSKKGDDFDDPDFEQISPLLNKS